MTPVNKLELEPVNRAAANNKYAYRLLVTRPRITIHEQLHYGVMIVAFRFLQRGTLKLEKAVQIVLAMNIMVIDVLLRTRKKTNLRCNAGLPTAFLPNLCLYKTSLSHCNGSKRANMCDLNIIKSQILLS